MCCPRLQCTKEMSVFCWTTPSPLSGRWGARVEMKPRCHLSASSSLLPTKKLWKAALGKHFLMFGFFKLFSLHYIWCTLPVMLLEQDYLFILWCFSLDASLQKLMILWQKLHVDMKSLLSWQYLMRDIQFINSWNFIMVRNVFTIFYANGVCYILVLSYSSVMVNPQTWMVRK